MKKSTHEKIAGAVLACSFLHFSFCTNNFIAAEVFRELALFILMIWFISIWMSAKSIRGFCASFLLLFWMAQLFYSNQVANYINFSQQEADFVALSKIILQNDDYHHWSIYQNKSCRFVDKKNTRAALDLPFDYSIPSREFQSIEKDSATVYKLRYLFEKTQLKSFQVGQDFILFNFESQPSLRYYWDDVRPAFWGDHRIKKHWYWVEKAV